MEEMICTLIFIVALAGLVYRAYRFLTKDEITTCFGGHYTWKGEQAEEKQHCMEEDRPKCPLE